jgi:hypothetical protein
MPNDTSGWNSGFRERFLDANANLDFISHKFADVLRDLMRASVARDPTPAADRAAERMNFVADLLSRTKEKFSFHDLFSRSLELMRNVDERADLDAAMVDAAERGLKLLVERSCDDDAARGRISQREHDFLSAIDRLEEARHGTRDSPRKRRY